MVHALPRVRVSTTVATHAIAWYATARIEHLVTNGTSRSICSVVILNSYLL
jgi:hypothetical protein